jgi:hypothetical protein
MCRAQKGGLKISHACKLLNAALNSKAEASRALIRLFLSTNVTFSRLPTFILPSISKASC